MFTHFKSSIKTSLLPLLFIIGNTNSFASSEKKGNVFLNQTNSFESQADTLIHFQVNSEISYLSLKHFAKAESKSKFKQAWQKEMELGKISAKTDSLRKIYSTSLNDEKEKISVFILKNEEHSMALGQEIAALYQSARELEDQYWQTRSAEEKTKIQQKIKVYSDSLTLSKLKEETQKMAKIMTDTILIQHETSKSKQVKGEPVPPALVYKIQIGAFKGKIPDASNKMIKKLSMLRKVENFTDEKGMKIYTTGNLKTHQEAVTMQSQVKQEGVKNPVIVAFQKGKQISVDEARKLNKE